jgi:hypothetical protein
MTKRRYAVCIKQGRDRQKGRNTMKILINAKRNGYGTEQCDHTMTVGELIEYLQQFEEDAPVYLKHDGGYTFGGITEGDFEESDDNQEEE